MKVYKKSKIREILHGRGFIKDFAVCDNFAHKGMSPFEPLCQPMKIIRNQQYNIFDGCKRDWLSADELVGQIRLYRSLDYYSPGS